MNEALHAGVKRRIDDGGGAVDTDPLGRSPRLRNRNVAIEGIDVARLTTASWPRNDSESAAQSNIDTITGSPPWARTAAALSGVLTNADTW